MSLKTWKTEFYRITARKCPRNQAIRHSLTKWEGLTKENLEKHGLEKIFKKNKIQDPKSGTIFEIDSKSCALCSYFLWDDSADCPILDSSNFESIESSFCNGDCITEYQVWIDEGDPMPMIIALNNALNS